MVCKWRQRFVADRLDGLAHEPRPGAPRRIGDEQIEVVLVATLETPTSMLASLVSRPAKSSTSTPSPEVGHKTVKIFKVMFRIV
jgi:transposase